MSKLNDNRNPNIKHKVKPIKCVMRIPEENKKKNGPETTLEKVIAQYLKNL